MNDDMRGACLVIGAKADPFKSHFDRVLAPELRTRFSLRADDSLDPCVTWIDPLAYAVDQDDRRGDRANALRQLALAPLAVFDMTADRREFAYLLGAREALTAGVTIACTLGASPDWAMALCKPVFADLAAPDAARRVIEKALRGLVDRRDREHANDFRRAQIFRVGVNDPIAELQRDEPATYRLPGASAMRIGVKCGDLARISDVDVWVNSENDRMQMARETDASISAKIRYLGSNRLGLDGELSDDAIAVALARAMGARQRVPIGYTLVTAAPEGTDLQRANNVRAVAHVASVRPAGPGRGFEPGHQIGHCVSEALAEIRRYTQRFRIPARTVLFPLLSAGDGGVPPELAASQMVGAVIEYAQKDDAYFRTIYLLAHKARNKAAIVHALRAHGCEPDAALAGAEPSP